MSNIGQQLQDARNRQGFSIKEVSDVIHIRSEYLGKIEDNLFDIPLHPVYIKGFIRLYAKFLKLDPDEIVDGFNKRNAQLEFSSEVSAERESLGTYTLPGSEDSAWDDGIENNQTKIFELYRDNDKNARPPWFYLMGIGIVVILLFATVFTIKVNFFQSKPRADSNQTIVNSKSGKKERPEGFSIESLNENLIGLVAKAPVYIYVTQTKDNEILYSGRLETDERETIIREGEISIACDKSENLIVEKGGIPIDLKGTTGKAQFIVN